MPSKLPKHLRNAPRWIIDSASSLFYKIREDTRWVGSMIALGFYAMGIMVYLASVALLAYFNVVNRHTVGYLLENQEGDKLVEWVNKGLITHQSDSYSYAPSTYYQSDVFAGALLRGRSGVIKALLAHMEAPLSEMVLEVRTDRDRKEEYYSPLHLLYIGYGECFIEQGHCPESDMQVWEAWFTLRAPIQEMLLEKGAVLPEKLEKSGNDSYRALLLHGRAHLLSLATAHCPSSTQMRTRL